MTPLRTMNVLAVLVLVGLAGGACGGGSSTLDSTTASSIASTGTPDLYAFSRCMRERGITAFPDPGPGGISIEGVDRDAAEFAAAKQACGHLLPTPATAAPGRESAGGAAWEQIVPGGDCTCADGSEFSFWERKADPTRVVLYLEGGGACTDEETCAFTGSGGENDDYDWSLATEHPAGGGIFEFDRADNPFAGHSFIYVPLCTGDVYLGDMTRQYSEELTVEHKGFVNGSAALTYLAEHYPDATQVVVVGKTAGSIAAPLYGGLVADLLPDAQITVFGAQSGHFPDDPDFNTDILGALWGAYATMPDWDVNDGLAARDWGVPRFWIQAGLHAPDLVMARFDYAYDPNAAKALERMGVESSTLELIDANEAAIEAAGVTMHSYTAPGSEHGIFEFATFYELEVDGVSLVDWLTALLDDEPLADVRCEQCETG